MDSNLNDECTNYVIWYELKLYQKNKTNQTETPTKQLYFLDKSLEEQVFSLSHNHETPATYPDPVTTYQASEYKLSSPEVCLHNPVKWYPKNGVIPKLYFPALQPTQLPSLIQSRSNNARKDAIRNFFLVKFLVTQIFVANLLPAAKSCRNACGERSVEQKLESSWETSNLSFKCLSSSAWPNLRSKFSLSDDHLSTRPKTFHAQDVCSLQVKLYLSAKLTAFLKDGNPPRLRAPIKD